MCRHAQAANQNRWFRERLHDGDSPPNLAAVLAVLCEVARGMAFLHAHSIIHGDLNACAWGHLLLLASVTR